MRRLVLSTVLAAAAATLGACTSTPVNNGPIKAPATPAPTVTATPAASPVSSPEVKPTVDPKASPVKPGTTPEVKRADDKDKDKKLVPVETPKK